MLALQTNAPPPDAALAVLPVLVVLGAIVGRIGRSVVTRLSNPVGKYRLLYVVVLFPFALLAYVFLALLGLGPNLAATLPVGSGPGAEFVSNLVELLAGGLVWLAAYTPTVPGIREARDIELSTRHAVTEMVRYIVGLSVVVAAVITALSSVSAGLSPLTVSIGLAGVGVLFVAAAPWLIPVLRSTTRPTGDTADRIATLRSRAGLDVRDVRILDTDEEETATTIVRGPPGYRRLFVSTTFLEQFDDRTATALLAVQAGRIDSHLLPIRGGAVIVGGIALVTSLDGVGPRWPLLGASLLVVVVGFWLSRLAVRAADDYAVERVGGETVADALERYADVHALEPTRRRLPNPLSVKVARGDRIDRVADRPADD